LSEDWQFCFSVKGLVAPEKEVTFDDLLIRGIPPSHDARVFFKVTIKNEKEKDDLRDNLLNALRNIVQIYGLVANTHVEVLSGSSSSKISSEHPFGYKRMYGNLELIPVFDEEERRRKVPFIEKTMSKYESIKSLFQSRKKGYLRNAIDYYYRSLGDFRLEEKLIDLMISLESLFSGENRELRLRYSLRASFLLGVGQKSQLPNIFRNIYQLYDKRSKVVHGTQIVDLDEFEISIFQKYVREAIQRFIHIEMPKKEFLQLLDESVYNESKRAYLNQIVLMAIEKW
jgi:hypothetical protein